MMMIIISYEIRMWRYVKEGRWYVDVDKITSPKLSSVAHFVIMKLGLLAEAACLQTTMPNSSS